MQVILYPPSVQRERLSIPLGKVNVLLAPACGAVLLIGDCIVLHPVKPQPGHLIQLRDVVVVYHVAEPRVKLVQGVAGGQIHLSIPNGHISLGIHGAEVAEQYLVVLLPGAQCNGAYWVIQAVLARILHLLNDEGRREGLERLQQLAYLFSVHGERLISIIEPVPIPVKRQCLPLIGPGEGLDHVTVDLQDDLSAGFNPLLALLYLEGGKCRNAAHRQDS